MSWPDVSIIMTVVNEERHLAHAVEALLQQDYPGSFDIVVAVGPSHDRTRDVAEELAARHPRVHVVDNPSGRTPSGLNAAIARSTGTVVVRIDGHAMVPVDYVRTGVETLRSTGADNVGGIMAAEGTTPFECAVARAMTSPFGVGGASFHIGGTAGPALTVYLGCFQRAALERVGGYDDTMIRAQDWEMNLRIRDTGGVVWFTPEMRVTYRPRPTSAALARQYHDYGRWRREVTRRHPDTLSLRYLAAPVMVAGVSIGCALALVGVLTHTPALVTLGLLAPVGYLAANAIASFMAARRVPALSAASALRMPWVFALMHVTWGVGFLRGGAKS